MKIDLAGYRRQERRMSNKELRYQLFEKDSHCYWCGIETQLYIELSNRGLRKKEVYPPDMATIEHLYDRLDPRRYQDYNNKKKVLSCYKCNYTRAQRRNEEAKEVLTERGRLAEIRKQNEDKTPRPLLFPFFKENSDTE